MTERVNSDYPPFSRVFVVCSKTHKEEDLRVAFERFGNMEDIWMVKDRMTKENKGICYVKYDKASAAAMAIETLDGTTVGEEPKPIKVGRAHPRVQGRRTLAIRTRGTVLIVRDLCPRPTAQRGVRSTYAQSVCMP